MKKLFITIAILFSLTASAQRTKADSAKMKEQRFLELTKRLIGILQNEPKWIVDSFIANIPKMPEFKHPAKK